MKCCAITKKGSICPYNAKHGDYCGIHAKLNVLNLHAPNREITMERFKRIRILKKLLHWKQLDDGQKRANIKKGANKHAFDFMRMHAGKFVRVADVQDYCSQKRKEETGRGLGDPPRSFEILRKDRLPLEWDEFKIGRDKYVKFAPHMKRRHTQDIIDNQQHRGDGFSDEIIQSALEKAGHKCAITGIPISDGGLAADHFIPKEKGGKSVEGNCVILNKILNEKKNNMMPVEWFCKTLLTNFIKVCVEAGLVDVKQQLIARLASV